MQPSPDTFAALISRAAAAIGEEAGSHVALAKAEIVRDAGSLATRGAPLAVGLALACVGHLLLCVALSLALAPVLGAVGGFLVAGAVNVIGGGLAIRSGVGRLRAPDTASSSAGAELRTSAGEIVSALRGDPPRMDGEHVR